MLFYHFFKIFFLIIDFYFLIPGVIVQTIVTKAELLIPMRMPTKEAKAEM